MGIQRFKKHMWDTTRCEVSMQLDDDGTVVIGLSGTVNECMRGHQLLMQILPPSSASGPHARGDFDRMLSGPPTPKSVPRYTPKIIEVARSKLSLHVPVPLCAGPLRPGAPPTEPSSSAMPGPLCPFAAPEAGFGLSGLLHSLPRPSMTLHVPHVFGPEIAHKGQSKSKGVGWVTSGGRGRDLVFGVRR